MRRFAVLLVIVALPVGVACGSGKSAPSAPAHDITPTTAAAIATSAAASATETGSGSSIVPLFLQDALSGVSSSPGSSIAGLGQGDPTLEQYLLTQADLPSGYTAGETFNARAPDGISKTGGGDMAAAVAMKGTPDSGDGDMLMSMVMRFNDLQDLDTAFGSLSADQVQSQLGQLQDVPGGLFTDVHALDTTGLGDQAAGFSMTMDMGVLLQSIIGSFADAFGQAGTPVAIPTGVPTKIEMHMYFFGRGSYAGALMHMSFGDADGGVNELGLAKVIDQRLASAAGSGT
ncbi:MAG TPA: hypothetical protein VFY79_05770 [Dehalococcoidia bacterium]|nr:hypothetical protein [Dehalococcoidia bacterium]